MALRRAQAYYPARLAAERPDDGSVQAQAQSALRKRFYTYAAKEVARGYVREGDSFEALFPHLPANTAQMRGTELFVQAVYPVSVTDASRSCTRGTVALRRRVPRLGPLFTIWKQAHGRRARNAASRRQALARWRQPQRR